MKIIEFTGHSDDLIHVNINGETEEYNDASRKEIKHHFTVYSKSELVGVLVLPIHDKQGCWTFAVSRAEEGDAFPDWGFRLFDGHDYCTGLYMSVPEDAEVVWQKEVQ